jgi:GTP-binding protein HflX
MTEVNKVLQEIGANDVRQLIVWNKIDLTEATAGIERDEYDNIARARLSARSGEGLELLRESLVEISRVKAEIRQKTLAVAARDSQPIT